MKQYSPQERTNSNVAGGPMGRGFGSAFTIIELLIVIVIIGVLVAIVAMSYNGITNSAKKTSAISTAAQAGKKIVTGSMTKAEGLPADKAGALVLMEMSETGGETFQYTKNASANPDRFCLTVSEGKFSAHIVGDSTGTLNQAIEGPCSDQTGEAPDLSYLNCPTGFIPVPGSSYFNQPSFCVMKYEAKNDGSDIPVSRAAGTPWTSISQINAITKSKEACDGCGLISEPQWMTIAHNIIAQDTNWSGGTVGSGYVYSGHNDNVPAELLSASAVDGDGYFGTENSGGNQKRTLVLSNGETIWDLAGNAWEWTDATITGNQPGLTNQTAFTWNQYNNPDVQRNGLPIASWPLNTTYGSAQGVGQLLSNPQYQIQRAFRRGGTYAYGSVAGVVTLNLDYGPSGAHANIGFRVAR